MTGQLIVVDVETTGLIHGKHFPIEVAALNVDTGQELYFVPFLAGPEMGRADGDALRINRYYEREVYKYSESVSGTWVRYQQLIEMLKGNVLAAANPSFDARMIKAGHDLAYATYFGRDAPPPACELWKYRMPDISAYAAGVFGIDPRKIPGLHSVCERLHIENKAEHTALGDVYATAACFKVLHTLAVARQESK
ncbi:Exonuclease [Mycobacteroides abscessus subsp. massiliense]|uniref:3'-5' exonuclease n=1 Tax=Mycobacteroides abscessus TaxID=36809 RepID=UPI0009C55352|nr:3'-5' exonuclease [Mycobacteroides abscessus]SKM82547.1 Exonuclease [Mycobacteroides abscessus subsp. massiliense]SKM99275.1 Exonuclease [Mycobacteroides abscessus subsp. massiliense]SKN77891.1 Exonuclease [Mycobacteroides abscessus subsp. massiliense]SKN95369.1 Exonuclease [Mycobacteroides abscessus subsp. massiliense]SKO23087.1 Exonuclease [Mycobacteroides abscessus subsp. massiliense]